MRTCDKRCLQAGGPLSAFCLLLTIVLVTLKLEGMLEWDWTWVLSPIWIPAVILFILFIAIMQIFGR